MEAHPETNTKSDILPLNQSPVWVRIPEWQQFPAEKRAELTQILAGMLVRQVQEARVKHEQPA
ncbi:MAG TPA: hypothetical protein VMT91_04835 [Anaerolineales bacterium]|nr:hypothetical protein [Anaerolineales bacterium]